MTEQKPNAKQKSSTASKALREYQALIEQIWAESVTRNMEHAAKLKEPILFNFVPVFLEKLSQALDSQSELSNAMDGSSAAQEHGAERVRLTTYEISDVVTELQLLKDAIYSTLENKITLSKEDRSIIERSIDVVTRDSVTGFVLAEAQFRERYIAMLAHDIRNPLAFITMATHVLKEEIKDFPDTHGLLDRILDNATRATQLIQNILDANLIRENIRPKLKIQSVDILTIVTNCARNWGSKVVVKGESIIGYWSPEDLTRAIENLLENANKYGENTKPISISIKETHDVILLQVHNEGDPIPAQEQETIFQPLRRAKGTNRGEIKGWGFGLPIVRRIAEAHGGSVSLDSTPERGTTFTIELPVDSRPYQDALTLE